jgi:hypothetical protein
MYLARHEIEIERIFKDWVTVHPPPSTNILNNFV